MQVQKTVEATCGAGARALPFGSRPAGLSAGPTADIDISVIVPTKLHSMCALQSTFAYFFCVFKVRTPVQALRLSA